MATCTTMTAEDPFSRAPTPRPLPTSFSVITKQNSYQSLNSPVLMSPVKPFSPVEPEWPLINVISPSTASHHSLYSDADDDFRSPRLALLTSDLDDEPYELDKLISPSAPIPQAGDELLYDVATEEKPDEPFFHPDFQAALAKAKQEMKDISLALWGCPAAHQPGSDIHALKQRAQELSEFDPSTTRTIAFIGNTGTGKSGIINALLDQPYLASSIDGESDDHFSGLITEYRFRPAHHHEPFAIEVDYTTLSEVKELIEELLRAFRGVHGSDSKGVDSSDRRDELKERSEKAWTVLHSMFRNQPIFTRDFVLHHYPNETGSLSQILEQWSGETFANRPGGQDARSWSATAFTVDECLDKLEVFTTNTVKESTQSFWPFVRHMRIYLRSPILQSGVVLADCPALGNLDYARSRSAEQYIRNCQEVCVVTTMKHALFDKDVSDIIARNGQHRPLSIICTKSDDISIRSVQRGDSEVSLQVRTWRQQIDALRMQVKRNEAQRRHGYVGALEEEMRTRDMLEEMEFGLKKLLVERRNSHVASLLIDQYATRVQMGDLKVFCVSGHDYWSHRYDEQQRAMSRLELSGIVDLRKYCHSVTAEAQFETAMAFIEHEAPALLGSLQQWAIGGTEDMPAEKAAEIRQVMKTLEELAINKLVLPSAHIHTTKASLNHEFASAIVLPIREHRSEWRNAALEMSKEWTKWNAEDYASFCRHYGTQETKAGEHRNWNEDLIAPMRLQLQSNWGFFNETVEESQQELITSVKQVFEEICAPLREHLPSAPTSVQSLLSTIDYRQASILHTLETSFTDLFEATQQLESDSLYGHLTSHINTLMVPAYHAASALANSHSITKPSSPFPYPSPPHSPSPSLIDQQRKDIITTHIASYRLFPKLSTMIEKAHRALVKDTFDKMVEQITQEVDALIRDLGMVGREEGERCEAERYKEFAKGLGTRVRRAMGVVDEGREVVDEVVGMYLRGGGGDGGEGGFLS